jgi:hypothetical protein
MRDSIYRIDFFGFYDHEGHLPAEAGMIFSWLFSWICIYLSLIVVVVQTKKIDVKGIEWPLELDEFLLLAGLH